MSSTKERAEQKAAHLLKFVACRQKEIYNMPKVLPNLDKGLQLGSSKSKRIRLDGKFEERAKGPALYLVVLSKASPRELTHCLNDIAGIPSSPEKANSRHRQPIWPLYVGQTNDFSDRFRTTKKGKNKGESKHKIFARLYNYFRDKDLYLYVLPISVDEHADACFLERVLLGQLDFAANRQFNSSSEKEGLGKGCKDDGKGGEGGAAQWKIIEERLDIITNDIESSGGELVLPEGCAEGVFGKLEEALDTMKTYLNSK